MNPPIYYFIVPIFLLIFFVYGISFQNEKYPGKIFCGISVGMIFGFMIGILWGSFIAPYFAN